MNQYCITSSNDLDIELKQNCTITTSTVSIPPRTLVYNTSNEEFEYTKLDGTTGITPYPIELSTSYTDDPYGIEVDLNGSTSTTEDETDLSYNHNICLFNLISFTGKPISTYGNVVSFSNPSNVRIFEDIYQIGFSTLTNSNQMCDNINIDTEGNIPVFILQNEMTNVLVTVTIQVDLNILFNTPMSLILRNPFSTLYILIGSVIPTLPSDTYVFSNVITIPANEEFVLELLYNNGITSINSASMTLS